MWSFSNFKYQQTFAYAKKKDIVVWGDYKMGKIYTDDHIKTIETNLYFPCPNYIRLMR